MIYFIIVIMSTMASSTESQILVGSNFSVKDIGVGKVKVGATNGKKVTIFNSIARKPLMLSTPMMLTWGVNENDFEGNGKKNYDMSLQFPTAEFETEETAKFLKNMIDLEEHVMQLASDNSKDWFGKPKMSKEVLEALYTPMIRYSKDKTTGEKRGTPPTLRIKLPYWDGVFKNMEVFDLERNQIYPSQDDIPITEIIPKGTQIATIISCGGIWFANGKFGVTWKLFQAMVKPKPRLEAGTCHIVLSSSDKSSLKKPDTDQSACEASSAVLVESDEEVDPEKEYKADTSVVEGSTDADKPEEVPAVPTKGKKVTKKS